MDTLLKAFKTNALVHWAKTHPRKVDIANPRWEIGKWYGPAFPGRCGLDIQEPVDIGNIMQLIGNADDPLTGRVIVPETLRVDPQKGRLIACPLLQEFQRIHLMIEMDIPDQQVELGIVVARQQGAL